MKNIIRTDITFLTLAATGLIFYVRIFASEEISINMGSVEESFKKITAELHETLTIVDISKFEAIDEH